MAAKKRRTEKHLQAELKRRRQEQQSATFPPFVRYEHPKEYLRIDRDVHQKFLTLVHAVLPKITHLLEDGETPQLDGTVLKFQRFQINDRLFAITPDGIVFG